MLGPTLSIVWLGLVLSSLAIPTSNAVYGFQAQFPLSPGRLSDHSGIEGVLDHPLYPPRIRYDILAPDDVAAPTPPPEHMELHELHVSGNSSERVNLMFFSDGYTLEEEGKFIKDAQVLCDDIIASSGAMGHVKHLLNIWAVFVPSNISGVGTHSSPLPGAAFGLYRPGAELRAVFVDQPKKARAACSFWREERGEDGRGGCDQAILLGNDPLYGGLGGEFTIITGSKLNGPLVLRHELGHSLIPVGEEYEGGFAYFGANSDKVKHINQLKWKDFLSDPTGIRMEDVKVPLQVYPWHNLTDSPYNIVFTSSNPVSHESPPYPSALLRASLSSIPYPSHIKITLNSQQLNLTSAFLPDWAGSKDRRWLEIPLEQGLSGGINLVSVELTAEGDAEAEGQGGKMITSLDIMEYGGEGRFNQSAGFIGAFPTYAMDGSVTLRPTNEGCLMRKVNHPTFCPVCASALKTSLEGMIASRL